MSHEITRTDGFFTVRQPAWHHLFEPLAEYPTREEAKAIAHPWEPVTEPVYRYRPASTGEDGTSLRGLFTEIEGSKAVVRSDIDTVLGVVNDSYEPVTNAEMYYIAEALQGEDSDVLYETGGSLKGGSKVWLLLRLNEPLKIDGDPNGATIPYYALQNAHDGSGAFRGQATLTRIVCDNTSKMADLDAKQRGTEFTFRHTKHVGVRVEEAKRALEGWRESIARYERVCDVLLNVRVREDQMREYVDEFIPMPPQNLITPRVRRNVVASRTDFWQAYHSKTNEGIRGTAYSAVQTSIEYAQHYRRARSKESAFQRSYLDRSRVTTDAKKLILEIADPGALINA